MRRLIDNFKERFSNRQNASYAGLKIAGLIALVVLFGVLIWLILSETVFGAEAAVVAPAVAGQITQVTETALGFLQNIKA